MTGLVERLRFHGRYAAETEQERAIRKNKEREEAADRMEQLENTLKLHAGDCLSLNNDITALLEQRNEDQARIAELEAENKHWENWANDLEALLTTIAETIEDTVRGSLMTGFAHGPLTIKDYQGYEERCRWAATQVRAILKGAQHGS